MWGIPNSHQNQTVRYNLYHNFIVCRAVASLTVPGGQEFHFPHFSSNFDQFFLFFLKLYYFLPHHFDPSDGRVANPGRRLPHHWLYGCESCVISKAIEDKINAFGTSCYRIVLNINIDQFGPIFQSGNVAQSGIIQFRQPEFKQLCRIRQPNPKLLCRN